jgi:hypothetical protein
MALRQHRAHEGIAIAKGADIARRKIGSTVARTAWRSKARGSGTELSNRLTIGRGALRASATAAATHWA